MTSSKQIPVIDLVGDIDENFYQLGMKDAEAAKLALKHTESLIKTPWQNMDAGIRFLAKNLLFSSDKWKGRFSPWIKSYAEGLEQPVERVMLACLIPELTACLNKWLPSLPKTLLGCSSLFYRDEESRPIHVRTLDFPLGTTFDKNERLLRTNFTNQPIITSYGSAGFPYPSLTACTSEGISFALHQKFNDVFDPEGTPIFELVQDMLIRCGDVKTVLGYLRKSRSLTTWSFHMSFKDGQVLEADISGDQLHYELYQLEDDYLYFNNDLIKPKSTQNQITPLNFKNYNLWRKESAERKIAQIKKKEKSSIVDVLKVWTTLEKRKAMGLDVLTPSSLHVCAMNPTQGEFHSVLGSTPKTWRGQVQKDEMLWSPARSKSIIVGKERPTADLDRAWHHLLCAQAAFDLEDNHQLHHHLQMALRRCKDTYMQDITKLYLTCFAYLHERHPRALAQLLNDVQELAPKLHRSLRDHAWLLISRIERELKLPPSIVVAQFHNPKLGKVLEIENSLPNIGFALIVRNLIHPRIDLLDFIYTHEQLDP